MSTAFRHVTLLCLLLVQFSGYHALPTTDSLISGGGTQPASRQLQTKIFNLEGVDYTAVPLNDQGRYSHTYKLEEPFLYTEDELVPAILKRVSEPMSEADSQGSKTLQEIGFLERESVDLYLFHQWSTVKNKEGLYDVDIVVKDVGKADPPFKPIDEWYKEIPTITARDALLYARDHVEQALLSYAHYEHLLYRDHTIWNIFFRKTALAPMSGAKRNIVDIDPNVKVMPIDWGPQAEFSGVVDVANIGDAQTEIGKYSNTLGSRLKDDFTVEKLAEQLWAHNGDLRSEDYFWKTYKTKEYPNGVQCRHLFIRTTGWDERGQQGIYKVADTIVAGGERTTGYLATYRRNCMWKRIEGMEWYTLSTEMAGRIKRRRSDGWKGRLWNTLVVAVRKQWSCRRWDDQNVEVGSKYWPPP